MLTVKISSRKIFQEMGIYDSENKMDPGVQLSLPWGYIHVYDKNKTEIIVKQVYWHLSQVSGERLQDHWSSGFLT